MPITVDFFDFKCFNQLRNGENFSLNPSDSTPNLVGNVGEKLKVRYKLGVGQYAAAENSENWQVSPGIKEIERASGSFIDDGVRVGQKYYFYANWLLRKLIPVVEYTGIVEFISSDGKILKYSLFSGVEVSAGFLTNIGIDFNQREPENINTAFFLKFGLLENTESFNNINKVSQGEQVYYVGGLTDGGGVLQMESLGIEKDWVSGNAEVQILPTFVGETQNSCTYEVSHVFTLTPFYSLELRNNILNNITPDSFKGANGLKYSLESEFRTTLSNTGSSKSKRFDKLQGFTGWFNENFNGLNPNYEIVSVNYEDDATGNPLEAVNINLTTKATIVVSKKAGAITSYNCGAYIVRAPISEDQYTDTQSSLLDNFFYKNSIASNSNPTNGNISTSIVDGKLVIEFTVDYNVPEKLQLTTENEYLLFVQVEDPTTLVGNSDRLCMIADFKNYTDVNFLEGFVTADTYNFITPAQTIASGGNTNIVVSNEDGIILLSRLSVDTTKNVVINGVRALLNAYNPLTGEFFNLDSYTFSLGDILINNSGIQIINVSDGRGYPVSPTSEFNQVSIDTGALVGTLQKYNLVLSQKIKWQEWQLNNAVPAVFFNDNQPNNNRNNKSSNYSGENGYGIRLSIIINVTGVDDLGRTITGDVIIRGNEIVVNDYDESADSVTGVIDTLDPNTGQSLAGALLFNGRDTLFRTTFNNVSGLDYGIHRIEVSQSSGDGIYELSSYENPNLNNNLMKPLTNETRLKYTPSGSQVITECLIDGTKIQEGVNYKLSARIGASAIPFNFGNFKVNFDGISNIARNQIIPSRNDTRMTWWIWLEFTANPQVGKNIMNHEKGAPGSFTENRTITISSVTPPNQYNVISQGFGGLGLNKPYNVGDRFLIMYEYTNDDILFYQRAPSGDFQYLATVGIQPMEFTRLRMGEIACNILDFGVAYNVASPLTSFDVDEMYNSGNGIDVDNHSKYGGAFKSHWRLDEGTGLILNDSGNTNYDLNLLNYVGSPWLPV